MSGGLQVILLSRKPSSKQSFTKRLSVCVIDSGILCLNTGWLLGGRRLPQTCMSFETIVEQYICWWFRGTIPWTTSFSACSLDLVFVMSYRLLLRHPTNATLPAIEAECSSYDGSSNTFRWCFEWWCWLDYQEDQGWKAIVSRTTSSWHAGIYLDTQEGRHVWIMNTSFVLDFKGMWIMKTILV